MFYLVLLTTVYAGTQTSVIPVPYPSEAECHEAGKAFDLSSFGYKREHVCIKGYRP